MKIIKVTKGEGETAEVGYEVAKPGTFGDSYMFSITTQEAKDLKEALNARTEI